MIAMPLRLPLLDRLFGRAPDPAPDEDHETEAQRRAWVQEMLCAHPEACGSDHDLAALLGEYPGSF